MKSSSLKPGCCSVQAIAPLLAACWSALQVAADAVPPIALSELEAPRIAIVGDTVNLTVSPSVSGRRYQLQQSDIVPGGGWVELGTVRVGDGNNLVIPVPYDSAVRKRFYRLVLDPAVPVPDGFALVPAGNFQMGDQSDPLVGYDDELPVHTVYVSGFFMAKYEVTKELWDSVRAWGLNNGYKDLAVGNGSYASKGANHPVHSISWYDLVKWCNARSEKERLAPCYTVSGVTYKTGQSDPVCNWSANGYRLPTEAEWEKAARGGLAGKHFPSGNTITHSRANYYSDSIFSYDVSPTRGFHPTYAVGGYPYSAPAGSFEPNGYGLYDMAGNMYEWCWDWFSSVYYASSPLSDPRGPISGSYRVFRGGSWLDDAFLARCTFRGYYSPENANSYLGFRLARSPVP